MKRFAIVMLLLATLIAAGGNGSAAAADTPVLLTVAGEVGNSNRPAYDAFRDAFFKYHKTRFARAYDFDYAALLALPQVQVTARAEDWPAPVGASGPRLQDVLTAAGVAADAIVSLVALDGYAVELDPAGRAAQDWVLAIAADGAPLGLGGRGPAWLLYDTAGKTVDSNAEATWVWSVFLIRVGPQPH